MNKTDRGGLRIAGPPVNCCWLIIGLLAVLASGCGGAAARDRREEQHPLLTRARQLAEAGRIDDSRDRYMELLEKEPRHARAHLDLGQLFEKEYRDYIAAIYHYRRYLDMRPGTEKREMMEEIIDRASRLLLVSLGGELSPDSERLAELKRQNAFLRERLARLTPDPSADPDAGRDRDRGGRPSSNGANEVPRPLPEPAEAAITTYEVQRGDSLSRIALRVYGNADDWRKILAANRDQLQSPDDISPGQVLVIP